MDETVTIPLKEYNKLVKDQEWLESLEAAGVDNWQGYDEAVSMHREFHPDEEED